MARCQFDLPEEDLAAMADEGQLAQVFQNLVRNAAESMPQGGTVRVKLSQHAGFSPNGSASTPWFLT